MINLNSIQLFLWAFALNMILIFSSVFILMFSRLYMLRKRMVKMSYFRVYEGSAELTNFSIQSNRNYSNHFEINILFFVLLAFSLLLGYTSQFAQVCALVFAISRLGHMIVHLTFNDVNVRFGFFATGVVTLLIWFVGLVVSFSG